ncbi:Type II toxin-antitoxin system HicA family toxin [Candidatus Magnetomoraceae bacterium gMMP-15]
MPNFGPIKRKKLINYLKKLKFKGPYSGGKHQFMIKGDITIQIPNPHKADIGKELLKRILRRAKISKNIWEKL